MREGQEGRKIIIIGNEKHPEVKGILGWCPDGALILSGIDEVTSFGSQSAQPQRLSHLRPDITDVG